MWRKFYYPPEQHPRISAAELEMLRQEKRSSNRLAAEQKIRWRDLLRLPQTWGIIAARAFTDPSLVLRHRLVSDLPGREGHSTSEAVLSRSGFHSWLPISGNFAGGAASGYLIRRGWPLGMARKAVVVAGGLRHDAAHSDCLYAKFVAHHGSLRTATFSYACFSTIANVLPADLYHSNAVATVSGLSGTGSGIGTIIAMKAVGYLSDARISQGGHAFDPIVIACGIIPVDRNAAGSSSDP